MARYRYAFKKLAPRWLTELDGELVLWSLMTVVDTLAERARQSVLARFPGHTPPDALGAMSRDRGLIRGFAEPSEVIRLRLLKWLDVWKAAGNARVLMDQIAAYLYPHDVTIRIVTNNGLLWYTRDSDGTFSYDFVNPSNWDWDGESTFWSRFWVILYPSDIWTLHPNLLWGDTGVWGSSVYGWAGDWTVAQVQSIRSIVRRFKPAGTRCVNIIIASSASSFDPTDPPGTTADGTWGFNWDQVSDPEVFSRLGTARYWMGTS